MRIIEDNWKVLASLLPARWQQMARQSGAVERLRGFPTADLLLRILLLHVARGYSLRETVVRAKLARWAEISDVALLKRLRTSEGWLRLLCSELFRENVMPRLETSSNRKIRIVDGTIVKEPGKTGSQWRILYSIGLPSLVCDFFEVTPTSGEGSGESLTRLPVKTGELILADAGYCSVSGIEYVSKQRADVLIRVNPQSFVAYHSCGRRFSLLPRLRTLSKAGQLGEWRVVVHGQESPIMGRLCAVRKSDRAIQLAHRRLQRKASKKQMITRPETFEFAKYVIVFTTCVRPSPEEVLRFYGARWQIELVFKRLKSLAQLGHVPKHDDRSSRAWLYGKLLVTLLAQKLIRIGRRFPPASRSRRAGPPSPSREFSFCTSPDPARYRTVLLVAANALFMEPDCACSCGTIAQATTSIECIASLVTSLQDEVMPALKRPRYQRRGFADVSPISDL